MSTFAGKALCNHNAAAELAQREADQAKAGVVPKKSDREKLIEATAMQIIYAKKDGPTISQILDGFATSIEVKERIERDLQLSGLLANQRDLAWEL